MAEGCQNCNTCHSCNRCQGCQRCMGCNSCQTCNICESDEAFYPCNTAQTICSVSNTLSHYKRPFHFSPSPTNPNTRIGKKTGNNNQDQNIFDRQSWNKICEWINDRTDYGTGYGDKSKNDGPFSSFTGTILTAAEFNRVANTLHVGFNVKPNDLIYGSYFESLENATRTYKFSSDCCYYCNSGCDTQCDSGCQKCEGCQDLTGCMVCQNSLCKDCSSDNQIAQYCS